MNLQRLDTGVSVALPDDYYWENQFSASRIEQVVSDSLTGAVIVEEWTRDWCPIVLRPWNSDASWIGVSTLATLDAWASVPGLKMILTLRGVDYLVCWHTAEKALEAEPCWWEVNDTADTGDLAAPRYRATLRFLVLP